MYPFVFPFIIFLLPPAGLILPYLSFLVLYIHTWKERKKRKKREGGRRLFRLFTPSTLGPSSLGVDILSSPVPPQVNCPFKNPSSVPCPFKRPDTIFVLPRGSRLIFQTMVPTIAPIVRYLLPWPSCRLSGSPRIAFRP